MGFFSKRFKKGLFRKYMGVRVWSTNRTQRYREYLKSDAWKRKRYVVLIRDNWTCQISGTKATEVHHKKYAKIWIGIKKKI